jgi:DNA-directed RNA polymerase subunit M/transcription elongation factor TFIIS
MTNLNDEIYYLNLYKQLGLKELPDISGIKTNEDFYNLPIFKEQQDYYKYKIDKLTNKSETNDQKCPKCGEMTLYEISAQKRRGDEGETTTLNCSSCGFCRRKN